MLSVAPHPSVSVYLSSSVHPVPTIYSEPESRRNFKFHGDVNQDMSNCEWES